MRKMLIISFTDLTSDPRPLNQIKLLRDQFEITVISKKPSGLEHKYIPYRNGSLPIEILRLILLLCKKYDKYYWKKSIVKLLVSLKGQKYDIIIAHNERSLPLAQSISSKAKVIFDAHEYYPEVFNKTILGRFQKKYNQYYYKNLIKKPDAMFTVSEGISDKYYNEYNLKSEVIMNLPSYYEVVPYISKENIFRIIHHGSASSTRKIGTMIKMMDYLDDQYHLDLMLVCTKMEKYHQLYLKYLVRRRKNVNIINPVSYERIIPVLNKYDIGLFLLPPTNYSLEHSLPNKLFEFIQARLAVAIGPSPEMARIVKMHRIGVVSENYSPQSLAEKIKMLSKEEIKSFKYNSDAIAKEYSYTAQSGKIIQKINELLMQ